MYEVTVEDTFSSGHYLRNYKGKCERPHGHNYRVRVTLSGEQLDQAGLLLDFKDLKEVLRPVINYLDHQMMNELEHIFRAYQRDGVVRFEYRTRIFAGNLPSTGLLI